MESIYLIAIGLCFALAIEPQKTLVFLIKTGLMIQVFVLNYRMKFLAWRLHQQLRRTSKGLGISVPPFEWTNVWDR